KRFVHPGFAATMAAARNIWGPIRVVMIWSPSRPTKSLDHLHHRPGENPAGDDDRDDDGDHGPLPVQLSSIAMLSRLRMFRIVSILLSSSSSSSTSRPPSSAISDTMSRQVWTRRLAAA